jgi:hypothetical protein
MAPPVSESIVNRVFIRGFFQYQDVVSRNEFHEELYDTETDPHETHNLAGDPDHEVTLERLRGSLDQWLDSTPDLGAIPEEEMRERFWPGGRQPVTDRPSILPVDTDTGSGSAGFEVTVSCTTGGASIGYRILKGEAGQSLGWKLYTGPFRAEAGDSVEAMAMRYGWRSSGVVKLLLPSQLIRK